MADKHRLFELFTAPLIGEWPRIDSVEVRQKLKSGLTEFRLILRLGFSEDAPYYDIEDWWRCLESIKPAFAQCATEVWAGLLEVARAAHAKRVWQEEVALHVGGKLLLRGGPGGYGSAAGRQYQRALDAEQGELLDIAQYEARFRITIPAGTAGQVVRIVKGKLLVEVGSDQFWVPAWELRPGLTTGAGVPVPNSETVVWLL